MNASQGAFLIKATKFVATVLFAYAVSSLAAATVLLLLTVGFSDDNLLRFSLLIGIFALPFVLVSKYVLYSNGLDGFLPHTIAGLLVGLAAGVLFAEARSPSWVGAFALSGTCGSLAYLGSRNVGRRVVGW